MSSILKALKKLEDKAETAGSVDGAGAIGFKGTRARCAPLFGWSRLWPVCVISGFFLVALGWYFFRVPHKPVTQKPVVSKPAENSASQQLPPQVSPAPKMGQRTLKPPAPAAPAPQSAVPLRSEAESQGVRRLALPNQRPMDQPEPAPKPFLERSVKETIITEKPVVRPTSPAQSPPVEPRPSLPISSPSSPAPLPALSQGDGLKLDGLFWSPVPERRVAVINSQLVKEGEQIDSAEIKRIEQEHVVLQKEGRLWQLRYRSQR